MDEGKRMYELAGRLFPICRSITGDGFRQSLDIIREELPEITVHEVPSGTEVFDWTDEGVDAMKDWLQAQYEAFAALEASETA